jgi:hypothetical protein
MNWKAILIASVVLIPGTSIGQDCTVGGPYSVDANTLLLLHFDGTYVGAEGETPAAMSGTEFHPGKFSDGVYIDGLDFLHYPPFDNIALDQGTVEFWIQPNWFGNDGVVRTFFETGAGFWADRLKVAHDGAGNLRFQTFDYTGESGIYTSGFNWAADDWYHVGVTWDGNDIALYVNAELRAYQTVTHFPATLDKVIKIGSGCDWGGFPCPEATAQPSKAVIDEFRVSDVVRCFGQIGTPVETLSCAGFEPPLANGPVKVKGNRALPLKTEIFDADGFAVTDGDLAVPPVVQIWYEFGTPNEDFIEVEALPAGQGDEGNQFVFTDDEKWQFNLKTANYTASGTYTIFMETGDDSEYVFATPTCTAEFVVK